MRFKEGGRYERPSTSTRLSAELEEFAPIEKVGRTPATRGARHRRV